MKRFLPSVFIFGFFILLTGDILAQSVKISAELRPRYEFRHGYKTLFPDDASAANFISQRTRLNGFFSNKAFKAFISLQDVRVWGDVKQLNKGDVYGFSVHEAWGQVFFGKVVSLKVGRQEIIFDDHRMFGNVGWAQQARSHDAAIIGLKVAENHLIKIGIAYNAMEESLYKVIYTNSNYKTFQLVHYHGHFGKSGLSFLFLNNGMAYDAEAADTTKYDENIAYSQTVGARYSLKGEKVRFNIAVYFQGGKNKANKDLAALYFGGDVSLHLVKGLSFGLGGEYLSGTATKDKGVSGEKDKSFTPFYGTNHKFNGWMDYFFVGNHGGNVGLVDIYIPLIYKVKKITLKLIPHYFMSAATVSTAIEDVRGMNEWKDYSSGLGTEIDFSIGYAVAKSVVIAGGYSQMFATETMGVLKGGDYQNTNNWAWIMITFKPTFFSKE